MLTASSFRIEVIAATEMPQRAALMADNAFVDDGETYPHSSINDRDAGIEMTRRFSTSPYFFDWVTWEVLQIPQLTLAIQGEVIAVRQLCENQKLQLIENINSKDQDYVLVSGGLQAWLHILEPYDETGIKYSAEIQDLLFKISTHINRWAPDIYKWWMQRCHENKKVVA